MTQTTNPYAQTLLQKGYSAAEIQAVRKPTRTFPCVIGSRTFDTEAAYNEALADFLNGY